MSNRHGLTDAQVLAALYNRSRPQGNGWMNADPNLMEVPEAQAIIDAWASLKRPGAGPYVDYLRGRVIKVNVGEDPLDFFLYERDLGRGAGDAALMAMLDHLTRP